MLSIQLLSIQIDISWNRKTKAKDLIQRQMHANTIEKKMDDMKSKCYEYIRYM